MVLYSTASCNLVKALTTNGEFERQKALSTTKCSSLAYSHDETVIYVSGISGLSPVVMKFNASDFSLIGSKSHSSLSIINLKSYTYSGVTEGVIITSISSVLFGKYEFTALDMAASTGAKQWSKQLNCPST